MGLTIVTGPPASGKSTWVRQHASSGDIVIDFDTLANALTLGDSDNHNHAAHTMAITKAARTAAINAALRHTHTCTVYIIHSTPSSATLQRYRRAGAQVVQVDPGPQVVEDRCRRLRPPAMLAVATRWYDQHQHETAADQNATQVSASRDW